MTRTSKTEQTGKDVKNQFKPISEADLETLAGTGSFGRGLKYFRSNYITDAILRGDTLYAQCYGSQAAAYRLSAMLVRAAVDENTPTAAAKQAVLIGGVPITAYACECEAGGFCKHLVALLLTWINKPESIGVRAEFAVRLQTFSQEQLLKLCVKLLERQPDMEYLIDVVPPPVTPSSEAASEASGSPVVSPLANARTVDVSAIRRRVQKAFQQGGRGYDEYYGRAERIAEELQPLMETGGEYAEAGQWANAQAIYETIALEAVEEYEDTDDEGDLSNLVNNCCDGLASCLDAQAALPESARLNAELRHQLIQSLYKVWEFDRHMGGIGLANDAQEAIARNVTPTERAEVETWLRSGMKPGVSSAAADNDKNDDENNEEDEEYDEEDYDEDEDEAYDEDINDERALFLIALKVHSGISDEEKLAEYRKHGLYTQIMELLLAMGRVDEAMQTALEETPTQMELTAFAGKLLNMGSENVTRALEFVAKLQEKAAAANAIYDNAGYLRWLADRYAVHNQPGKALEAQKQLFTTTPSLTEYRSVRKAAQLPGNPSDAWTLLRPELIAALQERKDWHTLTDIYVEEAQAREALDALQAYDESETQWRGGDLHARVAGIAETEFPDEARVIYQLLAENLIERRGRDNYQLAASYLARAKDLAGKANRLVEWNRYFTALRDNNTRLTALKEELRARKLL